MPVYRHLPPSRSGPCGTFSPALSKFPNGGSAYLYLGLRSRRDSNFLCHESTARSFRRERDEVASLGVRREEQASAFHSECRRRAACGWTSSIVPYSPRFARLLDRGRRTSYNKVVAATASKSPRSTCVGFGQNVPGHDEYQLQPCSTPVSRLFPHPNAPFV